MLQITLKSGVIHNYPDGKLDNELIEERLKQEFWKVSSDNNIEIYRVSEIAHISISKNN